MPLGRAKTWLEIDSRAYKNNIEMFRSLLPKEVTFCSVLKANAYGHGLEQMALLGSQNSISTFGVDRLEEAQSIRSLLPQSRIYVLGFIPRDILGDAVRLSVIQTVYDEQTVEELGRIALQQNAKAYINIKCETGTQRQGIELRHFKHLLAAIEKTKGLVEPIGISSHFSSSEHIAKPQITQNQDEYFRQFLHVCSDFGLHPQDEHISCSASTLLYPQTYHTMVRIGIAQYGIWPSDAVKEQFRSNKPTSQLQSILKWKTLVAQVKDLPSGTPVGYGQSFITDRPMRIAVLPIGYYDGFVRALAGNASVIVHGVRCPVIGSICMNMCMVNVSSVPRICAGDEVTIIGRDGLQTITVQEHAHWSGTIPYEVTTRILASIPRVVTGYAET